MNPPHFYQQEHPDQPTFVPAVAAILLAALAVLSIVAALTHSPALTVTVGGATAAVLSVGAAGWLTSRRRRLVRVEHVHVGQPYVGRVEQQATVEFARIREDGVLDGFELGLQALRAEPAARRCRLRRRRLTRDS